MANTTQDRPRLRLNTPKGLLKYPHLTEVDYGTQAFPNKEGSYNTRLILKAQAPTTQAFIEKLDAFMEQAKQWAEEQLEQLPVKTRKDIERGGGLKAQAPYSELYDDTTEEPLGEIEFRFKKKASGVGKDAKTWQSSPPPLFDASKPPKRIDKKLEIWSGSQAIINADYLPYLVASSGTYGLTARLNAVQIIELVNREGGQNAQSYGFSGNDEGYCFAGEDEDTAPFDQSQNSSADDACDAAADF
ncbi:hypothetical protein [Bartonella sp. DGB2]|uniref:hypothetical protein n=1 Tax=Bartonella sp. DGB2 TaxID=3388426 RepID=UPI00398FC60A